MGFRIVGGVIDIYNVILADRRFKSKGIMSKAFKLMCEFMPSKDITVKVLNDNPATGWYEKLGFVKMDEKDYILMRFK